MTEDRPTEPTKELLHTAMWTLLGMMAVGLVLVPLIRPSIVWTSVFFGWSQVMVGYTAFRMAQAMRERANRPQPEVTRAPPVVPYTYAPAADERPRWELRARPEEKPAPPIAIEA